MSNVRHNTMTTRHSIWRLLLIASWQLNRNTRSCQFQTLKHSKTEACKIGKSDIHNYWFYIKEIWSELWTINIEAHILVGMSYEYNLCSRPCRLTEFCNLQCISHFAAPFIVVRTETFVAEDDRLSSAITFDKIKQTIEFRQMQV